MDKKVLKFYEAPAVEAVEMMTEGFLCASGNAEGITEDPIGEGDFQLD